ncbi:MAG: hypothetical protein P9M08_06010, partial [Candidatus Erginobacter occultus]|nr:hypothetical protein [Candidatus Erginobacter occultus]
TGQNNCLEISGDHFLVENFAFRNAVNSGLLITGDYNIIQNGRSFDNGGRDRDHRGLEHGPEYAGFREHGGRDPPLHRPPYHPG